jgi:hypothetical protein
MARSISLTLSGGRSIVPRRTRARRAIVTYFGSALVVLSGGRLVRDLFSLPEWVEIGTAIIVAAALPVVLLTAFLQGNPPEGGRLRRAMRRVLTWDAVKRGAWTAVAIYAVVVAIYALAR